MAAKAVRDSKLDGDRAIDALFAALSDGDGIVRYYALDALRSVGGAAVIAALTDRLVNDRHTGVRQTAALGLGEVGAAARPAIPALRKALADENHLVRKYADAALLRLGSNPRSTAFDPGPR
jgi:HEAT repeat protein